MNNAMGRGSVVGGRLKNTALHSLCTVMGGELIDVVGWSRAVRLKITNSFASTVLHGEQNVAVGAQLTGLGTEQKATGTESLVAGGSMNNANGMELVETWDAILLHMVLLSWFREASRIVSTNKREKHPWIRAEAKTMPSTNIQWCFGA